MIRRILLMLCSFSSILVMGQGVLLDIEYQPNTSYQWTRSTTYDSTVEILGAEDMGDFLQQLGWEPYTESQNSKFLGVTMNTAEWNKKKLYFDVTIDSLSNNVATTAASNKYWREPQPLEIHDLEIHGVINHFQKIEIDSIIGVDSLHEKNRVFTMLDNVHRSLSYPTDTLVKGEEFVKTAAFDRSRNSASDPMIHTAYTLESIENGVAQIGLSYVITTKRENDEGNLIEGRISEGNGTGRLLYDMNLKQVVVYEYTMDIKSYNEVMDMTMESSTISTYRWTMDVTDGDN